MAQKAAVLIKRLTERLLLVCAEKCELTVSDRAAAARALAAAAILVPVLA
ncbi:MAG: hypothetical protein U0175_26585 [Caldilineaceae bacterium]